MKKMIGLLLVTFLTATGIYAQNRNPGGLYIKGGYNASNISTNSDGSIDKTKILSSYHIGFIADFPLAPLFSVQTGLLLNGKGSKSDTYLNDNDRSDNYVKTKISPLYLELPVNLVVKLPLSDEFGLFAGAGPYLAMGVGGKAKGESSFVGIKTSYSNNIQFNNDDPFTEEQEGARLDRLKKFDVGYNILAGVEVNRVIVGINYGAGLTKINSTQSDNDSNDKNKFRTWSLSVGVRL